MNTDLKTNTSITVDPSTPFCASTFFRGLREIGAAPYAIKHSDGAGWGFSLSNYEANRLMEGWHEWANRTDPNAEIRREHVCGVLAEAGNRVMIPLGY
jgi:hypothetical protein